MSRVQSFQRCDSVQSLMQRQEAEQNQSGLKAEPRRTDRTYRLRVRGGSGFSKIILNPWLHGWIPQKMLQSSSSLLLQVIDHSTWYMLRLKEKYLAAY